MEQPDLTTITAATSARWNIRSPASSVRRPTPGWPIATPSRPCATNSLEAIKTAIGTAAGNSVIAAIGPSRCGKGSLAHGIANDTNIAVPLNARMLINAGFSFDTDSLLDAVFQFVLRQSGQTLAAKIHLRVLIGQIMIRRNDPKTGTNLIKNAIKAANRIGYQRGVDAGHAALAEVNG